MATRLSPIRASSGAHIYCHTCRSIQPLVVDEPQRAEDGAYDFATDLVCGGCQFVVATTYCSRSALNENAVRKAA